MAHGKKKVVFDRKKRASRSTLPKGSLKSPSPSRSWSSASSSFNLTEVPSIARPGDTLAGPVSHPMPATKPVRYSPPAGFEFSVEELHDVATTTDIDSMFHSPAGGRPTTRSRARSPESLFSTSSHCTDSFGGVGVGSVPTSLMGGASLFVPEEDSWKQPTRPRSRRPHPADVGSLHSTSVAIPVGPLSSTSTYTALRPYASRRPAPLGAGLPTVPESYSSININSAFLDIDRMNSAAAQAARQARDAKLSSTLGRHASTAKAAPRTSALRREYLPGPYFPPIQDEPPSPREHGTIVQRGFPGVKPKVAPVLYLEKDPVKEWNKYRAYLAELKKRHDVDVRWKGKGQWWGGA